MTPNALDRYDVIVEVRKFNPYHDGIGRFTTPGGAVSFTWKPGASADHDRAIQNEKLRAAGAGSAAKKPKKQTSQDPSDKWRPKWMPENHRRNHETQDHHFPGTHEGWEAVQDYTLGSEEEAKAIYNSVLSFSKNGYEAIRKYAYEGPPPSTRQADAENIEKFISASPQWDDGPLYRGMSVKPDIAKKILADAKAGKAIGQRGPASWSSDRDVAENFAEKDHPHGHQHHLLYRRETKWHIHQASVRLPPRERGPDEQRRQVEVHRGPCGDQARRLGDRV